MNAKCDTCGDTGILGFGPDDYFNCPDCKAVREKAAINTTLAGVEGLTENKDCPYCNNTGFTHCACYGTGKINTPLPDYTTSLDPCMRVARKLQCQVTFTKYGRVEIEDRDRNAKISKFEECDLAHTLATMLTEIVKERQGE